MLREGQLLLTSTQEWRVLGLLMMGGNGVCGKATLQLRRRLSTIQLAAWIGSLKKVEDMASQVHSQVWVGQWLARVEARWLPSEVLGENGCEYETIERGLVCEEGNGREGVVYPF
jgi:hypothetical protein